jgi:hypothetical protein
MRCTISLAASSRAWSSDSVEECEVSFCVPARHEMQPPPRWKWKLVTPSVGGQSCVPCCVRWGASLLP